MSCQKYEIKPTDCPCLLTLIDGSGNELSLNLFGAHVRQASGFVHIQTLTGGAKIEDGCPGLSIEDIDALICECTNDGPNGSAEEPISVDLSSCMIPCGEEADKGVLPVRIVCTDSEISLACDDEGNIVFVDTSVSPPVVSYPDGSVYEGNISNCDQEYVETEICHRDPSGNLVTEVVVVNRNNIADTVRFWITVDGITDIQPEELTPCDEEVCNPYSHGYLLSDLGLQPNTETYNTLSVYNNSCCKLVIQTATGTHIALENSELCLDFDCLIDPDIIIDPIDSDSDCDPDNILITIIRKK